MKLSNDTREVLKNFSTINQNLLVKNGNTIGTMSAMKNIVSKATIPDTFDKEFAIYDLNEFLSALSLFKDPTLSFDEKSVRLNEEGGGSNLTYMFSDPSIVTAPKTEITMPSVDVEFTFTQSTFDKILKASAVLGVPDVVLTGKSGGNIELTVTDRKNDTSNDFSIVVGETDATFSLNFKVENIKILPGTYDVVMSKKLLSRFVSKDYNLKYYIALEPDSTFE